ncbi:MAG: dicarboxylate/amino acid:cation symporter [Spirochaetaceae bacterium]|jgi:Na+/H+-dicarboxylate symporter|nr:dicarboxylate/amino acid:cation symporter [Spirochaetaceae bacterium]
MKVWVKLLIGSILGVVLTFILPKDAPFFATKIIETAHDIALNIGRYTTIPLLFFGLTISIYKLRSLGKFWPLIARTFFVMIAASVLVISIGVAVTFIFPPERVPIVMEEQMEITPLKAEFFLLNLFPSNMLSVFTAERLFVFPLMICAFFMAIGLTYDNHFSKSIINLVDSFSRIFFHITAFFSEILGVVIIVISAYWAIQYRNAIDQGPFKAIILLLLIFSLVLGLLILPAMLYLFGNKKQNPWVVLYGSLAPAISSFFSGDINFSLPVLLYSTKNNLGIKRCSSSITVTLFSTFGRSGSSMVATVALIVIIKSYSSLGMSINDVAGIIVSALLLTFLLGQHSGNAAFVCLASLCAAYGNGFNNGYLILKPIAFFLVALGTFLDVMIAAFGSFVVASLSGLQENRIVKHFV